MRSSQAATKKGTATPAPALTTSDGRSLRRSRNASRELRSRLSTLRVVGEYDADDPLAGQPVGDVGRVRADPEPVSRPPPAAQRVQVGEVPALGAHQEDGAGGRLVPVER